MTSLPPYQQELLNVLQNPASARFGVITSVPGSGIRRVVEIHLREVASASLALVLCPRQDLARQWVERLRASEHPPVTVLISASSALDLLEGRTRLRAGVLVATYAMTRHGPGSRVLSELNFGLIVLDQPFRSLSNEVERLASRAQRVIAIVDRSQDFWSSRWPLLWDMTGEDLARGNYPAPVSVPYEPPSEERALHDEALSVLREHASRRGDPLILPSDSLPELHARLLTLASDTPEDEDLSEQAWTLLDQMEDSLASDSRLVAMGRILEREAGAGARCIVIVSTWTDAKYIAEHIASTGKAPRAVLSGATAAAERRTALSGVGPGESLVATRQVLELADDWPADSAVILWPSPVNRRVLEVLYLTAEGTPGVAVYELRESSHLDTPVL